MRAIAGICFLSVGVAACRNSEPEPEPPPTPEQDAAVVFEPLDAATGEGMIPPKVVLCEGGSASLSEHKIDDFDDGDGLVIDVDRRNGRWVVSNDSTGVQLPPARPALLPEPLPVDGGENYALHTWGEGFVDWGAAVGFSFQIEDGDQCLYNASLYQGIAFRVRGAGALRVEVAVPETLPVTEGGSCAGEGCGNRHGFPLGLTNDWVRHEVSFAGLAQESGFGQPALFDARRILNLRFRLPAQATFELWLDDVQFFPAAVAADAGLDAAPQGADASWQDGG